MFRTIADAMEKFFTPIQEINSIINASNTNVDLMTLLSLLSKLSPDPKNYKRTTEFKVGDYSFILIINSEVKQLTLHRILFDGKPTSVYIFPEEFTIDDGSNKEVQEYIAGAVCSIVKTATSSIDKIKFDGLQVILLYANFIMCSYVLYNTYKARVSIDEIYTIIKDAYNNVFHIDEEDNQSFVAITESIEEDLPNILALIQEVGIYKLLDCSYIVADYVNLQKRIAAKLSQTDTNDKEETDSAE